MTHCTALASHGTRVLGVGVVIRGTPSTLVPRTTLVQLALLRSSFFCPSCASARIQSLTTNGTDFKLHPFHHALLDIPAGPVRSRPRIRRIASDASL